MGGPSHLNIKEPLKRQILQRIIDLQYILSKPILNFEFYVSLTSRHCYIYRGALREEGEMVALEVQRPGVLEGISRDFFLLRNVAQALQPLP